MGITLYSRDLSSLTTRIEVLTRLRFAEHISRCPKDPDEGNCIGGKLCEIVSELGGLIADKSSPLLFMPAFEDIALHLQELRPDRENYEAYATATEIVKYNDLGQFERAYEVIAEFLGLDPKSWLKHLEREGVLSAAPVHHRSAAVVVEKLLNEIGDEALQYA